MTPKTTTYQRFPLARRIEHLAMLLSFGLLGLTGLPQKYPLAGISVWFVDLLGGIENLRVVHHVSATVLMLGTAWHILVAGYKLFVLRERMSMLPSLQDVKDGWGALLHNIGLKKRFPQMGRYTFEEKLEYWAFVWGAVIMGLTGFLMWNPITAARILPGEWIPAAKAAHGGEAVLAVLAIIIWHMYGVHLRRFNKSMWTGKMSEEEMLHEHPLELADLKAGLVGAPVAPEILRKRKRAYYPVAGLLTVAMLAGVYGFINTEDTALTTVPPLPSPVAVYVPQTPTPIPTRPPTATPLPATATPESQPLELAEAVEGPTWNEVAPLIQAKCAPCHSNADLTGLAMDTYANTLAGGNNGPVVIPGDSANSLMFTLQAAGGHPGVFSSEELEVVRAWIDAGAVESSKPVTGPLWDGNIAVLLGEKCGACHGAAALGGLNMSTYADAIKGGETGPVLVPGDSANSLLVAKQEAGGHPGQLTPEEIALVKEWIDAGALEK
jgi:cytochrome b subunit of formate dehydrogenase